MNCDANFITVRTCLLLYLFMKIFHFSDVLSLRVSNNNYFFIICDCLNTIHFSTISFVFLLSSFSVLTVLNLLSIVICIIFNRSWIISHLFFISFYSVRQERLDTMESLMSEQQKSLNNINSKLDVILIALTGQNTNKK